jgi:hypothetical protein
VDELQFSLRRSIVLLSKGDMYGKKDPYSGRKQCPAKDSVF